MKIYFKALGCRLNEAELEQWSHQFSVGGHQIINDGREADIVIVNSCAVTKEATRKSRKLMNRMHRENPVSKLVVTGCYATLEEEEVANRLGVDLVVNNSDKECLPQRVMDEFSSNTMPLIAMEPGETNLFQRGKQRAFIKIQDGCRYRCTYCIVTIARGEERSRPPQEIIEEVNRLHAQGIQEIVLTGVHVGGYGSDNKTSLFELVMLLLKETDIARIRFASVEPWDLPEKFFTLFENQRLMPHMHLPLQSGADSVLRRMSRRCKISDFSDLVTHARRSINGFNVTTDIIVGFPGETDKEWQQTLESVATIGFGHVHIFSYSSREGTKAASLPNQIAAEIKKQRSDEMHQLAAKMKSDFSCEQLGKQVSVLWESQQVDDLGRIRYSGYTPNFVRVETILTDDVILEGKVTNTKLLEYSADKGVIKGKLQ